VPRLDLRDAREDGHELAGLQPRRRAVVRADRGVLERVRELEEGGLAGERGPELERDPVGRAAAGLLDRGAQGVDVLDLLVAQLARQALDVVGERDLPDRVAVQAGLHVLEREQVLEQLEVVLDVGDRAGGERPRGEGPAGDRGAHEQLGAGQAHERPSV
jgi:hypothetical protein